MAVKRALDCSGTRANAGDPGGTPHRIRCKLDKVDDVKAELARLYRSARSGKTETQDASRLANMLSILGRLIEGSDLEKRLDALEKHTSKEKASWSAPRH